MVNSANQWHQWEHRFFSSSNFAILRILAWSSGQFLSVLCCGCSSFQTWHIQTWQWPRKMSLSSMRCLFKSVERFLELSTYRLPLCLIDRDYAVCPYLNQSQTRSSPITVYTLCLGEASFLWISWLYKGMDTNKIGVVLEREKEEDVG